MQRQKQGREQERLREAREGNVAWRKWGPYLSERQWGTVRDNGAGLGASHQTGWTGIVARLMHLFATTIAAQVLDAGKRASVTPADVVEAQS